MQLVLNSFIDTYYLNYICGCLWDNSGEREREKDIGRTCLVAPMLLLIKMRSVCIQLNTNVIRGLVKRAQLLWNVHNCWETCTASLTRAQHLWNVHNISGTCTTSLTRAQHLWNVHNISGTCTTSLKRAQHLWHVHNISETCTTSLKRAHVEFLKTQDGGGETRYTHMMYIYIYTWYDQNTGRPLM